MTSRPAWVTLGWDLGSAHCQPLTPRHARHPNFPLLLGPPKVPLILRVPAFVALLLAVPTTGAAQVRPPDCDDFGCTLQVEGVVWSQLLAGGRPVSGSRLWASDVSPFFRAGSAAEAFAMSFRTSNHQGNIEMAAGLIVLGVSHQLSPSGPKRVSMIVGLSAVIDGLRLIWRSGRELRTAVKLHEQEQLGR